MVMLFVMLFVLFVRFLTRDSSVILNHMYILEMSQSDPPRLAPYPQVLLETVQGWIKLTSQVHNAP